ncbi:lysine biosynthesis protein LysW [Candidatus Dojkabacteria bacterium]|nr:lysine biosynthesis protein LysW [Candidatus Dojkabacteria bacterium]
MIECPECENEIEITEDDQKVGKILECPFCGSELEIIEVEGDEIKVRLIEEEK